MSEVCSICGGSGLQVVQENGSQFARDCVCRVARRAQRMLGQAHIPRRYEHCILENYDVDPTRIEPRLRRESRRRGLSKAIRSRQVEGAFC
jgi:hypothetical protein